VARNKWHHEKKMLSENERLSVKCRKAVKKYRNQNENNQMGVMKMAKENKLASMK
jgi:hypothetical protein